MHRRMKGITHSLIRDHVGRGRLSFGEKASFEVNFTLHFSAFPDENKVLVEFGVNEKEIRDFVRKITSRLGYVPCQLSGDVEDGDTITGVVTVYL